MRDDLELVTPRLRRYARALLTGAASVCDASDLLVQTALARTAGVRGSCAPTELTIRLYAAVTQLHREQVAVPEEEVATRAMPAAGDRLAKALLALPLDAREALLLVALERLDHAAAARVLRVSRPVLLERLTRARTLLGERLGAVAAPPPAVRVPHLRLVVG